MVTKTPDFELDPEEEAEWREVSQQLLERWYDGRDGGLTPAQEAEYDRQYAERWEEFKRNVLIMRGEEEGYIPAHL